MTEFLNESLVESEQCRGNNMTTILDLPNEILDHVFSFLSIKERIRTEWVCSTWAEFGKNYKWSWPKKLGESILVDCAGHDQDYMWSSVLSRCGSSLKEIEISIQPPPTGPTSKTCYVIGAKCSNLKNFIAVYMWKAVEDSDALLSVTRGCTKLKKISIKMHSDWRAENAVNLYLALRECRALEYLELGSCSTVLDEGCLDAIMVPLKGFKLHANFRTNSAFVTEKLLRRSDPIEQLELSFWSNESLDWPMEVVNHYKYTLRELNLPDCKMSSSNWCKILVPLQHLEVLSVSASILIEDKFIHVLADSCKKLRMLDISYTAVTDVGVSYLTALPNLTVLFMNKNEGISGEGVLRLASCGRLEELHIAFNEELGHLIEQACIALITNCPNLRLLDVRYNVNITDRIVDELRSSVQRGFLKGPVTLHLSRDQVNQDVEVCENLKLVF